jgi:hypothetical protein
LPDFLYGLAYLEPVAYHNGNAKPVLLLRVNLLF